MTKGKNRKPRAVFQISNVLWHLDVFRRSFRELNEHACLGESCLFCALKELFSELQHSSAKAIPPDTLRKALADSFLDENRFQVGQMDDAAECFENLLLRIHDYVAYREPENQCAASQCVSHQKFAMNLVEQLVCNTCGAATEPMSYTQMVHYVSTSALVKQLRDSIDQTQRPETFGRLLLMASNMGNTRTCPASCGSGTEMCRALVNNPEIISIGLVWNSEKPTLDHIMEVFSSIETRILLDDMFNNITESEWTKKTTHDLVGVVTFYGKHYCTFFFHNKLMEWILLDDAKVRSVGPLWKNVVDSCKKNRLQPLLLLYATSNSTIIPDYDSKINLDRVQISQLASHQFLRRSITPSPEKPEFGNMRRAITPNPDISSINQKPPLPKSSNEYQNLSVIQMNIPVARDFAGSDQIDGCVIQRPAEYAVRNPPINGKVEVNIHRTLSNGSSSGVESGVCIPDHLNIPRRRDSGNWSGDRNSASSASSTTMENPYLYLVGKLPHGSVPGSPTRVKLDPLCGGNGAFDAGYDSYSLSSNDSTNVTTLQHIMKTGHLAQIPEDYSNISQNHSSQSCDVLCDEADDLLVKSRQLEDAHDLVLALALCNAASTKARAAMNAPYNNPQTLTLARMKHNTCIMRARSLHRRMTQTLALNKANSPEIRHTREGSSGSGRHSRQNSREKGQHSRQSSRELLLQQEKEKAKPTKNIEIYATLPKKKDGLKAKMNALNNEDDEYMLYNGSLGKESRSIFSRSKNKESKVKEKRSRSEDRNKIKMADFSIAPELIAAKDTLKKAKENKEKDEKKDKDGKNKKQHKIRRKLLMGGLIRRKNRSMPDLTDSVSEDNQQTPQSLVNDDANFRGSPQTISQGMSGYLSEGHLEFTSDTANPNLEKSKLMRKSFHSSAGKILTAAKVPPPPPLRTTSQLSRSKSNVSGEVVPNTEERCQFNIYGDVNIYHNLAPFNQSVEEQSSMSLPYYGNSNSSFDDDSFGNHSSHTVVTHAEVHQIPELPNTNVDSGVDEVDCLPVHSLPILELPPYPSPGGSAIHSRQASEDFPPPPPPIDLSALDEHLPKIYPKQQPTTPEPNSLLAQLQYKRNQILTQENDIKVAKPAYPPSIVRSSGDTWLKELQARQAALRIKKDDTIESVETGLDEINTQRYQPGEANVKSVRDLASKFENTDTNLKHVLVPKAVQDMPNVISAATINQASPKVEFSTIAPEQIAEEIREVDMITSAVNKVFGNCQIQLDETQKPKVQKKKSVSFCDQVTLVATAEEQQQDTYIPNPILERVLRTAVNNPETMALRQEIMLLRDQSSIGQSPVNQDQQNLSNNSRILNTSTSSANSSPLHNAEQPVYERRNSVDNVLIQNNVKSAYNNEMYDSEVLSQQGYSTSPHLHQQYPVHQQTLNVHHTRPKEQYYPSNGLVNSHNQYNIIQNHHAYSNGQQTLPKGQYIRVPQQHVQPNPHIGNSKPLDIKQNDIQQNVIQHHKQPIYYESQYKSYPPAVYEHNSAQPPHLLGSAAQQHTVGQYEHQNMYGSPTEQRLEHGAPPIRQSPYQPIPQNSPIHPAYYGNSHQPLRNGHAPNNNYNYSSSPRTTYSASGIRQSSPSPSGYPSNLVSTHSPSPVPSINTYHPALCREGPNTTSTSTGVFQRVAPPSNRYAVNYNNGDPQLYQRQDIYQRVPHQDEHIYHQGVKLSGFPDTPSPKHLLKKNVSFEPGTKGCESPLPIPVVTPIVVNNANNSIPTDKTKCSLCRKKNVVALNVYCKDCEFYMSRFNPKT